MGLSPLARGNRTRALAAGSTSGPIPARAGQPWSHKKPPCQEWAYPRSRGATLSTGSTGVPRAGLSPLARGNQSSASWSGLIRGPIPARAGQPHSPLQLRRWHRAYPRSRGATHQRDEVIDSIMGLSPLARGNRAGTRTKDCVEGPIPASAGQPRPFQSTPAGHRAYPRSRGATSWSISTASRTTGLSPLARGNRQTGSRQRFAGGPIPARAGQPTVRRGGRLDKRAYPRSRGATWRRASSFMATMGLSPLARGNRLLPALDGDAAGPIPARAGQPSARAATAAGHGAYPRSRGATSTSGIELSALQGLSPLARGNLGQLSYVRVKKGPIPARAGQPLG